MGVGGEGQKEGTTMLGAGGVGGAPGLVGMAGSGGVEEWCAMRAGFA